MKPMTWHPEERDEKVNQYLSQVNRAPYANYLRSGDWAILFPYLCDLAQQFLG